MATAELKSIKELFGLKFFVPSYQRGYRWNKIQIEELLEDLFDFSDDSRRDDDDYYCLQPIIVKPRGDQWELVDGQQRLTALWLFSALYYCNYRVDLVEGLVFEKYDIEYEEKPVFTELFSKITDYIDKDTMPALLEDLDQHKDKSIDSRNLINSIEAIAKFNRKGKKSRAVLEKIFENFNNIKIIWYVLDKDEDPILTFTNVNANKIELTNAELIKAVLLNNSDEKEATNRAIQWEELEKGLNNEAFWNFIVNNDSKPYSTRIDYLFEIICQKEKWLETSSGNDRFRVYRAVISHVSSNEQFSELWKKVQETYDVLTDWFNDYYYYHMIGLLIIVSPKQKNEADLINNLYDNYVKKSKSDFKLHIINELNKIYFSASEMIPFSEKDTDSISADLRTINYGDKEKVKNVLLLYNIALLVIANNKYERFPFDLYKSNKWDIEHVNPQTPLESTLEEKKAWLNSYKRIINGSDLELCKKIQNCLDNDCEGIEDVEKEIDNKLKIVDKDSIGNLVLLDSGSNRSYKNECFSEKRSYIINAERNCSNGDTESELKAKYIPVGTKWVFLKGYENANQLIVWSSDDMEEYMQDIAYKTHELLCEE